MPAIVDGLGDDRSSFLRPSDSILQEGWNGCSTTAELIYNACNVSSQGSINLVLHYLGTGLMEAHYRGNPGEVRAEVGRELQFSDDNWVSAEAVTPQTEYGPMLVTKMDIVRDNDAQAGWRIKITSEGMGRILPESPYDDRPYLGAALIRMNISNRSRTARAWRVEGAKDNTDPALTLITDTLDHGEFEREPWHTGTDIGGQKVDINNMPQPYRIPQKVIQIDIIRRGKYHSWAEGAAPDKNPVYTKSAIAAQKLFPADELEDLPPLAGGSDGTYKTGARNTSPWLGFGIGELLLDSVTVSTIKDIGNFKQLSYVFIAEPSWKHADQMPLIISNAGPMGKTTIDPTTLMTQIKTVLWNQTYFTGWETTNADWTDEEADYLDAMST